MSSYAQAASTAVPVTPVRQRWSTVNKHSPRTPSSTTSTPYTTVSSSGRSPASSTLTTPSSIKFSSKSPRQLRPTKSIADITENWRTRAQLNGIKVSATEGDEDPKKVPLLSPGYAPSFRRKSSPFPSPAFTSRRSTSTPNTPSPKPSKYTLGTFTGPSRRVSHGSPFSDISEDEGVNDRLKPALPAFKVFPDLSGLDNSPRSSPRSSCSVCDKEPSGLSRMIVLSPCSHVFCSSCFTGTLNIVGEKSMSCMECHSPVNNFHFALSDISNSNAVSPSTALLGNPFEGSAPDLVGSKPSSSSRNARDSMAVLRIDNVPWDVTPLTIKKFIKQPIVHAHVLLDIKGKTLSHAFVQLAPESARAALRSSQNAILGQGRRARAVTVTLSSQSELMAALYPHWRGSFDGYQPSLDGLDNQQVNEALQHGLLSNAELTGLFNLITTPDSHFLKVPSLPFYSLIGILSTFPADVDSRVFWTCQLRDALFRVTYVAMEILASREQSEEDVELWNQLADVSIGCRAFTTSQMLKLQIHIDDTLAEEPKTPVDIPGSKLHLESSEKLERLAEQFGLDPGVLAAVLQSFA